MLQKIKDPWHLRIKDQALLSIKIVVKTKISDLAICKKRIFPLFRDGGGLN